MVSVRIEDVKLPLAFRRIQAADLIGWRGDPKDERLIELVQAIAAILGGLGSGTRARCPEARGRGPGRELKLRLQHRRSRYLRGLRVHPRNGGLPV